MVQHPCCNIPVHLRRLPKQRRHGKVNDFRMVPTVPILEYQPPLCFTSPFSSTNNRKPTAFPFGDRYKSLQAGLCHSHDIPFLSFATPYLQRAHPLVGILNLSKLKSSS